MRRTVFRPRTSKDPSILLPQAQRFALSVKVTTIHRANLVQCFQTAFFTLLAFYFSSKRLLFVIQLFCRKDAEVSDVNTPATG